MALDIDKKSTALVVIDLQKGITLAGRPLGPYSAELVVRNAAKLAEAFRKNGMPVLLVHAVSSPAERLHVNADDAGWRQVLLRRPTRRILYRRSDPRRVTSP